MTYTQLKHYSHDFRIATMEKNNGAGEGQKGGGTEGRVETGTRPKHLPDLKVAWDG